MSIRRSSLLDDLTRGVLELISEGGLDTGDRLPATASLAKRFGVATPTMREAMRRLETNGVVDIRHGSGVYVRSDRARLVLATPHREKLGRDVLLDLLEARMLIEPELAERAARRGAGATPSGLEEPLAQAAGYLGVDTRALSAANMDFHAAIARAAGSRILTQVLEAIIELHREAQVEILRIYGDVEADLREHRAILASIRAGKPVRSRDLMRRHLRGVYDIVAAAPDTGTGAGWTERG